MAESTDNGSKSEIDNEPAPTRPTWKMLVAVVIAVLALEGAQHWTEISEIAHLPQIEKSLGIG